MQHLLKRPIESILGALIPTADRVGIFPSDETPPRWYQVNSAGVVSPIGGVVDNEITNALLADMPQATFKMRAAGAGTGDPIDGTAAQAKAALAIVAADIPDFDTAVRLSRLDQMAAPTGALSLNGQRITDLATPTAGTDAATKDYADGLVVGLWDDRGNYDASGNTFPASGGSGTAGAILKGDVWTVSVAGTLGGVAVELGDMVRALTDTPGQTAGNWAIQQTNIGYTPLNAASNLSDLASAPTARTNLGLDTAATAAIEDFDPAGAAADAQAASQPLNSNLTDISGLSTTSYGRGLLTLANDAALAALLDASFLTPTEGDAAYQPKDSDLTAIAALGTTGYGRGLLTLADAAALGAELAAIYQPIDSDLTAIAALTTTSFGRSFLDRADAAAGRTLLGLGTAAVENIGTSGANVPKLDGANTWGAKQIFADIELGSSNFLAWSTDLFLRRGAAGILEQRNGTNAQGIRVYKTYTDASNYERFYFGNGAFGLHIETQSAGTGLAKGMYLKSAADYIYMEASQLSLTNAAGTIHTRFIRIADGWLGISNAAGTGFTALQLGTTDGISPSLRPNGSTLEVGGVNNTQFAPFAALSVRANSAFQLNGVPGSANSKVDQQFLKTGIADATATAVITVTVPNGNHNGVLKMRFVSANGGTDLSESTRTAECSVIIARVSNADTAKFDVSIGVAGIATVASGATHTLAYATSALTGANNAEQTFTVNITIDDNGNVGSNSLMVFAELHNRNAGGITMAAA